ncbi:MAG: MFS transporter [Clostridia bacterium]|nr:MFS transporter [Clostridia bacterium]
MTETNIKKLKLATYFSSFSMSVVGNLPPLLFMTFNAVYGISYSLLGTLVLINFLTQLIIDLVFSFFSHKFNIPKVIKSMPLITIAGLVIFAFAPVIFRGAEFLGLALGTFVFSAAAGLGEVLSSPLIAALPSDNPDQQMSKLHSMYAWGVVGVIIFSTLFLYLFGRESWPILTLIFCAIPAFSALLYFGTEVPELKGEGTTEKIGGIFKNRLLWASVLAIFFGGAAECTMAQWSSGYLEQALNIPKVWGDIFGVAMFAFFLGIGRTLYSKIGKNIGRVLTLGGLGAVVCYLTAVFTSNPFLGLAACGFTGFCTSMLWPGNLIVVADRFPYGGVFIYAMMAAGGDLGASVCPQLVGIITDLAESSPALSELALNFGLAPNQLGMKLGMLVAALFPLIGIIFYAGFWKHSTNPKLASRD